MKIVLITDLYPVFANEYQTPKTLYNFVQGWRNLGHNVTVIRPNYVLNSIFRRKTLYRNKVYNDIYNLNFYTPFCFNVQNKHPELRKVFDDADLIISHMPCGNIFAGKLNKRFVAGLHCSDIDVLTKPMYSIYFKRKLLDSLRKSEKIACRSIVLERKLLSLYPEFKGKTFIVPSGVDESIIVEPKYDDLDFSKRKVKVLTCANLIKRKNIDKLIKALNDVENLQLTVVGDGEELNRLRGIDSNVVFTGRLSHNDVLLKMRESDIFILPSVHETFGLVYLEAMASGCVTIGIKNDGIDGIIIDGENGYLTLPNILDIKKSVLDVIKSSNNHIILHNAYYTVKSYVSADLSSKYLDNIFKKV